jgi:phospholipid/cholesterol/gamma-HCH transport system substrate-binding protein
VSSTIPLPQEPSRLKAVLTSKLNISALGVVLVFLGCVAYLMTSVLDIGIPLISSAKTVKVDLPSTGGIYVGAPEAYRGVTVGRITDITFTNTGVQADARIDSGNNIPTNTVVWVKSLSPVGEQYLDFEPRTNSGPYLSDGATITGQNVDVPETLADTVISVNKLLDQINAKQLQTILDESSKALVGTSGDLGRLADQGTALVNDLNKYWPNLSNVLTNSNTLLKIGDQYGGQIIQASRDFRSFAAWLKDYTPTLVATLNSAPAEIAQIQAVLNDAQQTVPTFLALGSQVTELLASYNPHLQALLANFAPGLNTLSAAVRNGSLQMSLVTQTDHLCDNPATIYHYGTTKHLPTQTAPTTLQTQGRCPGSFTWLQRGAAHAPGPVR